VKQLSPEITCLENILSEERDSMTQREIEYLEQHIRFLKECHDKFNKTLLNIENSKEIKQKINEDIANLKGIEHV
jgi:uncharacterized membrane protein YgaE (UPF0421/DUF939 family)